MYFIESEFKRRRKKEVYKRKKRIAMITANRHPFAYLTILLDRPQLYLVAKGKDHLHQHTQMVG